MKALRYASIILVAVLMLALAAIIGSGNGSLIGQTWAIMFGGPSLPFDTSNAVSPPDYSESSNWAALPEIQGIEDITPAGVSNTVIQGQSPVDVFFIHPTGLLQGKDWVSSLDPNSATMENTKWMMANQASAYNGCCNIYAPRYRQASLFVYLKDPSVREEGLAFAYQDVARAFDYFLENHNHGRPFIIASHSQGTHHATTLLQERIAGTELARRMVAAYTIGGSTPQSAVDAMEGIEVCDGATELGCVIHWDTFNESFIDQSVSESQGNVCVNPLSWRVNGGLADKSLHKGGVEEAGSFQISLGGDDVATGIIFNSLGEPIPNALQAQCKGGILYVTDQSDTVLGGSAAALPGGSYHLLDYPLFHMDIRENVNLKVAEYLDR